MISLRSQVNLKKKITNILLFTTLSLSHSTDALYRVDSSHKGLLAAMIGQALSQELGYIAMSQTSKITTLDFTFAVVRGDGAY